MSVTFDNPDYRFLCELLGLDDDDDPETIEQERDRDVPSLSDDPLMRGSL